MEASISGAQDWFGPDYYKQSPARDPHGPPYGSCRVMRCGMWKTAFPKSFRSARRGFASPAYRSPGIGFRVVAEIAPAEQAQPKTADPQRDQMTPTPVATQTASPGAGAGSGQVAVDLGDGVKLEMLRIPAGEFLMGSTDEEVSRLLAEGKKDHDVQWYFDHVGTGTKAPQHRVRITRPFYLGKYLVTQEQWQAVMGDNPSHFKGPRNPVETVNWNDCQAFFDKLNAKTGGRGGKFQLPTEAQWEYACRAGSRTRYYFGDDASGLGEYAWYGENYRDGKTHPVGEKKPNAWGLYDMHGNVWEWCADWSDGGYYASSPTDDPTGPSTGSYRVIRGGSWLAAPWECRSLHRNRIEPGYRSGRLGLRVARVPAEEAGSPRAPPAVLSTVSDSPPPAVALFDDAQAKQHQEPWAKHLGMPVEQANSIGMKLALIPPGEFLMGSPDSDKEGQPQERPQHRVRITRPFYLGKYLVTQAEWQAVMGSNPSARSQPNKWKRPHSARLLTKGKRNGGMASPGRWRARTPAVTRWRRSVGTMRWSSAARLWAMPEERAAHRVYRLPTEAQWEYACRAGSTTRYQVSVTRTSGPGRGLAWY